MWSDPQLDLRLKGRGHRTSKALLGCVRDAFIQRGEAGEQGVPLVLLGLPKFSVCAVEPVQNTKHPETLVEPVNGKHQEVLTMFYKQKSSFFFFFFNLQLIFTVDFFFINPCPTKGFLSFTVLLNILAMSERRNMFVFAQMQTDFWNCSFMEVALL